MKKGRKIRNSIEPVSIKSTKIILNQLINCIFHIKINGKHGTGFFCLIPFRKKSIKALMTNYHILNEKDLEENKKIDLFLNNGKDLLALDLEIKRDTYFNKDYDITIIELNEEDKIKDYLELDDILFQDFAELIYKDESVYILHYPNGKNAYISYGLLNIKCKYNITHNCNIDDGSSGSPILSLQNNKVIGIHTKNSDNYSYNMGTLLTFPIKDFINQKYIKMNRISITINKIEYYIIKELGKGGFGRVIQVFSNKDNKYYAIKQIPIKEETKEQIQSFKNEINILSQFNCNNIVKYYNSYKDNKYFYIIMEYCDRENLGSFIDKHRNNNTLINENIIKNIIKQICLGINEIHKEDIVHRDLKPENIFINGDMDLKIGDFGISKKLSFFQKQAKTVNKAGSDYYTAPEIKKGIYNKKSDIWSLGCIIYELFNLNIYYVDKSSDEIKKIDTVYNYKWQKLIDSLLQENPIKRFDINQVNKFLK